MPAVSARRTLTALLTTSVATAAFLVPAGGAEAAGTATSCYGGAKQTKFTNVLTYGPVTTTSRCTDINMRIVSGDSEWIEVCVVFVKHTSKCNYTTIVRRSWKTIATDVLDGTSFQVLGKADGEGATNTVEIAY
ncbi:hypothetical protein [Micromonospora zhanjiangensis]|uniref:Secreted protein n=1 Tax=Micromonospora zhanjiangensis TaxID=1522057 RepID=A0ABV8KUF4_9ACTN